MILKKIPLKIWFFSFSLVFLITSLFHLPNVIAETNDSITQKYSRSNLSLEDAILTYHQTMNDLFNKSIEKMTSGSGDLNPPTNDDCPDNNVSTFCVAMRATNEYDGFLIALKSHQNYFTDETSPANQSLSTEEALNQQGQREDLRNSQIAIAQNVLSVSLATYNEIQIFYPLHLEYSKLIKQLEKYRDGLSKVRREVEKYPKTFQNVSTTKCT
ncbi:MAG: hypothetical protein UT36_C0002G0039 [Candidatus Peregrinibacteria bacterium GW2011_GWF2_39_17]|nr:MAG: hypothetical protein UT36_C0002G0039 [Candidatus Peregrinibacteria bacterium GW2011_GWF2_39_17]HCW32144.1 hypothetical protein [Candidatus Peregrinibacteria bacterium]